MFKISKYDNSLEEKAKDDISKIKEKLKKEPIIINMFKEYRIDINKVNNISIKFVKNLDVSAKTINGKIYLNADMLKDDWENYFHYLTHETKHFLDHITNNCNDNKNVNYLDNPAELEAFKTQIEYKKKTDTPEEIADYLNTLYDKHNLDKNERVEKTKEILDKD